MCTWYIFVDAVSQRNLQEFSVEELDLYLIVPFYVCRCRIMQSNAKHMSHVLHSLPHHSHLHMQFCYFTNGVSLPNDMYCLILMRINVVLRNTWMAEHFPLSLVLPLPLTLMIVM